MRISAKADYAVRALAELAAQPPGRPVKAEQIATAQHISLRFLLGILGDLRPAGLVRSQRGSEGGYMLARPADRISIADVIRSVDGPLASVQGSRPEELRYGGAAAALQEVWVAVRANLRAVLETVTLADVASGRLPDPVRSLVQDEDVWQPH